MKKVTVIIFASALLFSSISFAKKMSRVIENKTVISIQVKDETHIESYIFFKKDRERQFTIIDITEMDGDKVVGCRMVQVILDKNNKPQKIISYVQEKDQNVRQKNHPKTESALYKTAAALVKKFAKDNKVEQTIMKRMAI